MPCYKPRLLSMLLLLGLPQLQAQESKQALPSLALLEYLADMTEVDGKLVGPQDMNAQPCTAPRAPKQPTKPGEQDKKEDQKITKSKQTAVKPECQNND
jgi:hypothetical protein